MSTARTARRPAAKTKPKSPPRKSTTTSRKPATTKPATTKPAAKPATKKTAAKPADDGSILSTVSKLVTPLTDAQREIYKARYSDDDAKALAGKTKAHKTLKDAVSVLHQLWPSSSEAKTDLAFLSPALLGYLVETTSDLAAAIEAKGGADGSPFSAALSFARRESTKLYANVLSRIEDAIGKSAAWAEGLQNHLTSDRHAQLDQEAAKASRLADAIGDFFKNHKGFADSLQLEGITEATQTALLKASNAVEEARAAATKSLSAGNDPPALNLLEGRVLYALRALLRATRRGREEGASTLVLRLSRSTLKVISPPKGNRKAKAPAKEESEPTKPSESAER